MSGADLGGFTGFQKLLKIFNQDFQQQNTQILINGHLMRIVSNKCTLLAMFKQLSLFETFSRPGISKKRKLSKFGCTVEPL